MLKDRIGIRGPECLSGHPLLLYKKFNFFFGL